MKWSLYYIYIQRLFFCLILKMCYCMMKFDFDDAVKKIFTWVYRVNVFHKKNNRYKLEHALGYFIDVHNNGYIDNSGILVRNGFDSHCLDYHTPDPSKNCTRIVIDFNNNITKEYIKSYLKKELKKLFIENKKNQIINDFV